MSDDALVDGAEAADEPGDDGARARGSLGGLASQAEETKQYG